jgi:DNA repair protein SbcC/Rad50
MKPRKLKIEGLNSFVQEQVIDFSQLTEKGFFGIFGPTGSGKSTILDAITIALYGEISRSGKTKPEFINSFRKDMNIYYEFEIGGAKERKIYSVERHYKRKKDGGISCDRAILSDITGDGFDILAEGSNAVAEQIVDIIGLKGDDFTRSVVLPQGKFSEFLKLTKGDRGKMLERILSLEEFGSKMVMKLKTEINAKNSELDILNGALSGFKDTSGETLELKKQELKQLVEEEQLLKAEKALVEAEYKKYSEIWELQKELELFETRQRELQKSEKEIQTKGITLDRAKRAATVKPFIESFAETNYKILIGRKKIDELLVEYTRTLENLKITEEKYSQAVKRKEEKLQILIVKETELVEALKLEAEINRLEVELTTLREEYETYKKKADRIEAQIKTNQTEKENSLKDIEKNDLQVDLIKVTPEYREKIGCALMKEKEYIDAGTKLKNINLLVNELGAHLVKKNTELITIANEKDLKEKELFIADERKGELEKNNPGDISVIYSKKMKLELMTNNLNELIKNTEGHTKLSLEVKSIAQLMGNAKGKLEEQLNISKLLKNEAETLNQEIENIKRIDMAGTVAELLVEGKPCPVCGAVHHPDIAKKTEEDKLILEHKEMLKDELNKRLENSLKNENDYKIELVGYQSSYDHKSEALKEIKVEAEGLGVSDYTAAKERFEAEYITLKSKIEKHGEETKEIEEKITRLKEEVHIAIIKYERALAEIEKDKERNSSLKLEQKEDKENFKKAEESFNTIKTELGVANIKEENARIINNAAIEEKLRKEQSLLRQKINELDSKRNELETEKVEALSKMDIVKTSGLERNQKKAEFTKKKNDYADNVDPKEYYERVKKEKNEIIENEAKLKAEYDEEKNTMTKLSEEKLKGENNIKTLGEILTENKEKLCVSLKENNFENENEAKDAFLSKENMDIYESEIKKYQEDQKSAYDNIARINKKLSGEAIDKENWDAIVLRKSKNEEDRESNTGKIAACRGMLSRMENDLKEIKKFSDQKKLTLHQLDLLTNIQELVNGNKFVEFAATNQLKYITSEASKRLGEITRGRYALELDSSNEFVMRDDFNGGLRRSADTLSGGETFLTSLCLALALSSNIQLKGKSPLEFFFLDEGFGTLDVELLEVVIASLERLRNDRLCVGIISHVEELKSRVPVKLIVTPATIDGEGTKVAVEYS